MTELADPASGMQGEWASRLKRSGEYVLMPAAAILVSGILFAVFLLILGKSPVQFYELLWRGGFGTSFSWQNTLIRASPFMLTALCVAIPARLGMVVIGGEGALIMGGFGHAA